MCSQSLRRAYGRALYDLPQETRRFLDLRWWSQSIYYTQEEDCNQFSLLIILFDGLNIWFYILKNKVTKNKIKWITIVHRFLYFPKIEKLLLQIFSGGKLRKKWEWKYLLKKNLTKHSSYMKYQRKIFKLI